MRKQFIASADFSKPSVMRQKFFVLPSPWERLTAKRIVTAFYANLITDRDGFTPIIALPTVDPALTLQPGPIQPYVAYNIRVTADGFQPVEHHNVPVYGDNYVTQPVAMTPIIPGEDANDTQEFNSGGPTNL